MCPTPVSEILPCVALVIVTMFDLLWSHQLYSECRQLTIASSYALFSPSDQMHDVLYLLAHTSQASLHLRSSETQATDTVCFADRLSVCSVSFTESAMSIFTAPKEHLKLEIKHYYILLWSFLQQFLMNLLESLIAHLVWLSHLWRVQWRAHMIGVFTFIVNLAIVYLLTALLFVLWLRLALQ